MHKIKTSKGETLYILSEKEYGELIARIDIAEADKVKREIAAARSSWIPGEVADKIMGGENPVRAFRSHKSMKVKDLAGAAGISPPYLSEIEAGKKYPSLETMKRLAEALGTTIDALTT